MASAVTFQAFKGSQSECTHFLNRHHQKQQLLAACAAASCLLEAWPQVKVSSDCLSAYMRTRHKQPVPWSGRAFKSLALCFRQTA